MKGFDFIISFYEVTVCSPFGWNEVLGLNCSAVGDCFCSVRLRLLFFFDYEHSQWQLFFKVEKGRKGQNKEVKSDTTVQTMSSFAFTSISSLCFSLIQTHNHSR